MEAQRIKFNNHGNPYIGTVHTVGKQFANIVHRLPVVNFCFYFKNQIHFHNLNVL